MHNFLCHHVLHKKKKSILKWNFALKYATMTTTRSNKEFLCFYLETSPSWTMSQRFPSPLPPLPPRWNKKKTTSIRFIERIWRRKKIYWIWNFEVEFEVELSFITLQLRIRLDSIVNSLHWPLVMYQVK